MLHSSTSHFHAKKKKGKTCAGKGGMKEKGKEGKMRRSHSIYCHPGLKNVERKETIFKRGLRQGALTEIYGFGSKEFM